MHNTEMIEILENSLPKLQFVSYKNAKLSSIKVENFNSVVDAVKSLTDIEILRPYIDKFLLHAVVAANENVASIDIETTAFGDILRKLRDLSIAADVLLDSLTKTTSLLPNSLLIKLPPLKTFEDLSKVANDFKLAIDIPLHEIKEDATIEKAEEGSIWLTIVTTVAGLQLLSGLVSAGLRIAKMRAEMKWYNEQSRTIGLKNDAIQSIVEAQEQFVRKNIEDEAVSIFSDSDPEKLNKLKLSIQMLGDLIERGAQIQPGKIDDVDIKNNFTDLQILKMITDPMKKIQSK